VLGKPFRADFGSVCVDEIVGEGDAFNDVDGEERER
jgi:hypothetical protein